MRNELNIITIVCCILCVGCCLFNSIRIHNHQEWLIDNTESLTENFHQHYALAERIHIEGIRIDNLKDYIVSTNAE